MEYDLNINNRAFKAIKEGNKKIEIRVTTEESNFSYNILKKADIIYFVNDLNEKIKCTVNDIRWYPTIEDLLRYEGTVYTLSSTNDFNEGVKSINSIKGYKEGIKNNGVYAIEINYNIF